MTYLAIDYGGGSGRVIAGTLTDGRLEMQEIHRFANYQVKMGGHVYWDFPYLFQNLKTGLKKAAQLKLNVAGIGIDTWGVDFGLIDRQGNLLGNPVCYRDARTEGMPERFFEHVNRQEHYQRNGTQVMPINTLFQLLSLKLSGSSQLAAADKLLFTPDLFAYFLTGKAQAEYTIASTSELLDARSRDWDWATIDHIGLPRHLFPPIVMPGTVRGQLTPELQAETGLGPVDVVAIGSHDTASAVAAVPATANESPVAFLSSGTWSLLGVELPEPLLSDEARQAEFTNEGGVGGRITFLQNITGLWIVQRLMAEWAEQGFQPSYADLIPAAEAVHTQARIDVADSAFANPPCMEQAIVDWCAAHGCPLVADDGHTSHGAASVSPMGDATSVATSDTLARQALVTRCVLQSLAAKYAEAVQKLNALLPQPVKMLHIIGGGSQNALLNRLTSEALGVPVTAGPTEATAMGNILTQAMAKGELKNLAEVRQVVRASL